MTRIIDAEATETMMKMEELAPDARTRLKMQSIRFASTFLDDMRERYRANAEDGVDQANFFSDIVVAFAKSYAALVGMRVKGEKVDELVTDVTEMFGFVLKETVNDALEFRRVFRRDGRKTPASDDAANGTPPD